MTAWRDLLLQEKAEGVKAGRRASVGSTQSDVWHDIWPSETWEASDPGPNPSRLFGEAGTQTEAADEDTSARRGFAHPGIRNQCQVCRKNAGAAEFQFTLGPYLCLALMRHLNLHPHQWVPQSSCDSGAMLERAPGA
eukprot:CAMPEP_0181437300 /NCGR_PEP_ID=MMETSP1110-20121109/21305_1 /TAXON_ID=174948 /ORGANISM="Symbiodinium sp., Strain CCMP421" /LENGTH=136 /DNA_ID=CAMNT_0023560917 /DNA_START=132 /DNA_END=543 /DNA_ORIENTATION=+